ncbi:MAG: 3'(2'),5'-bisphosphate nucleotidase CysQ [Leptospiraceae bacterium]|nr:3'(2'),5'-bisphosphate nucleotidase CysQ [Leptospiraceae bacterium]
MLQTFQKLLPSILEAGEAVSNIYSKPFDIKWKSKNDPLTEADLIAHKIIDESIKKYFPNDFFVSEEAKIDNKRLDFERIWILDPIDGTREFVNKNPEFAISLGLSIKNKANLGIIYNPITKELIYGEVGLGVCYQIVSDKETFQKINFSKFLTSDYSNPPKLLVSRTEFSKKEFDHPYWKDNFSITPMGSIAYKLGLIAAGKYDLAVSVKPKNEWDILAGVALIEASGGKNLILGDLSEISFNEENLTKEGIISGNPNLIEKMIQENSDFLKSLTSPHYNE